MDTNQIYQEQILDHCKNPRNKGKMTNASIHHHELNPLCGDELHVYFMIDKDIVKDVRIDGHGCAISQASASMLGEKVKGMKLEDVKFISKEEVLEMLGIPISAARLKCALLSIVTFKNAIALHKTEANK